MRIIYIWSSEAANGASVASLFIISKGCDATQTIFPQITLKRIRLPLLVALSVMLNSVRLATLMKRNVLMVCMCTVKQNNDNASIKGKFGLVVKFLLDDFCFVCIFHI